MNYKDGLAAARKADWKTSLEALKASVFLCANFTHGHCFLAEVALQTGDLEASEKWHLQLLKHSRSELVSLVRLGMLYTKRGDTDRATAFLRAAVNAAEQLPAGAASAHLVAAAYRGLGDCISLSLAQQQQQQQQQAQQQGSAMAAAAAARTAPQRRARAKLLVSQALSHYSRAQQLHPEHVAAFARSGALLLRQRDWARAAQALSAAVKLTPRSAVAHYRLARALAGRSRALARFSSGGRDDSTEGGRARASAIAHLQQATWLRATYAPAQAALAALLLGEQGSGGSGGGSDRASEAVTHCEVVETLRPRDPRAPAATGQALAAAGRHSDAVAAFRRALKLAQDGAGSGSGAGSAVVDNDDGDDDEGWQGQAEPSPAQPSVGSQEWQAAVSLSLATALRRQGDLRAALQLLTQLLQRSQGSDGSDAEAGTAVAQVAEAAADVAAGQAGITISTTTTASGVPSLSITTPTLTPAATPTPSSSSSSTSSLPRALRGALYLQLGALRSAMAAQQRTTALAAQQLRRAEAALRTAVQLLPHSPSSLTHLAGCLEALASLSPPSTDAATATAPEATAAVPAAENATDSTAAGGASASQLLDEALSLYQRAVEAADAAPSAAAAAASAAASTSAAAASAKEAAVTARLRSGVLHLRAHTAAAAHTSAAAAAAPGSSLSKSLSLLRAAVALAPASAVAQFHLAEAQAEAAAAITAAAEAAAAADSPTDQQQQQPAAAAEAAAAASVAALTSALQQQPRCPICALRLGSAHAAAGRPLAAADSLHSALSLCAAAAATGSSSASQQQQAAAAVSSSHPPHSPWFRLSDCGPSTRFSALYTLGAVRGSSGHWGAAHSAYRSAAALLLSAAIPSSDSDGGWSPPRALLPAVWNNLAVVAATRGDAATAHTLLTRATTALASTSSGSGSGSGSTAHVAVAEAAAASRVRARAHANLAVLLSSGGQLAGAAGQWMAAAALDSSLLPTMLAAGNVVSRGALGAAATELDRSLELLLPCVSAAVRSSLRLALRQKGEEEGSAAAEAGAPSHAAALSDGSGGSTGSDTGAFGWAGGMLLRTVRLLGDAMSPSSPSGVRNPANRTDSDGDHDGDGDGPSAAAAIPGLDGAGSTAAAAARSIGSASAAASLPPSAALLSAAVAADGSAILPPSALHATAAAGPSGDTTAAAAAAATSAAAVGGGGPPATTDTAQEQQQPQQPQPQQPQQPQQQQSAMPAPVSPDAVEMQASLTLGYAELRSHALAAATPGGSSSSSNSGADGSGGVGGGLSSPAERAAKAFRRAVALRPTEYRAHYGLGRALQAQGQWSAAVQSLEAALALQPHSLPAHHALARCLHLAGHPRRALPFFNQAVAMADRAIAWREQQRQRREQGGDDFTSTQQQDAAATGAGGEAAEEAEAEARMRQLEAEEEDEGDGLWRHPRHRASALLADMGLAHEDAGQLQPAADAYMRSARLRPRQSAAYSRAAALLLSDGQRDIAAFLLRRLEAAAPHAVSPRLLATLGDALWVSAGDRKTGGGGEGSEGSSSGGGSGGGDEALAMISVIGEPRRTREAVRVYRALLARADGHTTFAATAATASTATGTGSDSEGSSSSSRGEVRRWWLPAGLRTRALHRVVRGLRELGSPRDAIPYARRLLAEASAVDAAAADEAAQSSGAAFAPSAGKASAQPQAQESVRMVGAATHAALSLLQAVMKEAAAVSSVQRQLSRAAQAFRAAAEASAAAGSSSSSSSGGSGSGSAASVHLREAVDAGVLATRLAPVGAPFASAHHTLAQHWLSAGRWGEAERHLVIAAGHAVSQQGGSGNGNGSDGSKAGATYTLGRGLASQYSLPAAVLTLAQLRSDSHPSAGATPRHLIDRASAHRLFLSLLTQCPWALPAVDLGALPPPSTSNGAAPAATSRGCTGADGELRCAALRGLSLMLLRGPPPTAAAGAGAGANHSAAAAAASALPTLQSWRREQPDSVEMLVALGDALATPPLPLLPTAAAAGSPALAQQQRQLQRQQRVQALAEAREVYTAAAALLRAGAPWQHGASASSTTAAASSAGQKAPSAPLCRRVAAAAVDTRLGDVLLAAAAAATGSDGSTALSRSGSGDAAHAFHRAEQRCEAAAAAAAAASAGTGATGGGGCGPVAAAAAEGVARASSTPLPVSSVQRQGAIAAFADLLRKRGYPLPSGTPTTTSSSNSEVEDDGGDGVIDGSSGRYTPSEASVTLWLSKRWLTVDQPFPPLPSHMADSAASSCGGWLSTPALPTATTAAVGQAEQPSTATAAATTPKTPHPAAPASTSTSASTSASAASERRRAARARTHRKRTVGRPGSGSGRGRIALRSSSASSGAVAVASLSPLRPAPLSPPSFLRLGELLKAEGDHGRAAWAFAHAAATGHPDTATVHFLLGSALYSCGAPPAFAVSVLRYTLSLRPGHLGATNNLAAAQYALGRVTRARSLLSRALSIADGCQTRLNLGLLLEAEGGRHNVAARHLRRALVLCTAATQGAAAGGGAAAATTAVASTDGGGGHGHGVTAWDVQTALARVLTASGPRGAQEATALLREAVRELGAATAHARAQVLIASLSSPSPSSSAAGLGLGLGLGLAGEGTPLSRARLRWAAANATLGDAYSALAACLVARGRKREAAAVLEAVPPLRPAASRARLAAWVALGNRLLHDGKYERAREVYATAHAQFPSAPTPLNNLGVIAYNELQFAEALRWFRAALRVAPGHAAAEQALSQLTEDGPRFRMPLVPDSIVASHAQQRGLTTVIRTHG